jgi:uncharacterized protein involved in exopolysaccharide biosynthesis
MNQDFQTTNEKASNFSLRDLLVVGFRHKRTAMLCFFGILLGTILFVVFGSTRYTATTKFLVDRERMDPVVSPEQTNPVMMRTPVTEEELNSEIELLQSRDVLRQVVLACGLNNRKSLSEYVLGPATPEVRIEKATDRLGSALDIAAGKKSDLIEVSYTSDNAQLSAHVLQALGDAYIQKHSAVHTPPGQAQFFDKETARYKSNLADAEEQLKQFSAEQNGVAPTVARDLFLQKLTEFHLSLQQTRALLASTEERIKTLQKQAGITPERLTTEMKSEDDAQVLQGLKNTLMTLELKRTELLTKYQPSYPLVVEADKEISDTKASIVSEESKPNKSETTDRNPTYAWVDAELAKAKADYAGLKAQEAAMQAIVEKYETQARDLEQKGLIEQDLVRNYKAEEENYLLYLRKREEARMTDALDSTRIVNVAVAETPIAPSLPAHSVPFFLLVGILIAGTVSIGAVFVQEYLDPSFRTPTEVSAELNIPVLASVPNEFDVIPGTGTNGNGNGYGRNRDYSRSSIPTPISPVGQTGTH